jgi:hypothetical protein
VVVLAGSFQVENGFLETSSQGPSVLDGPESLVRFGIAKRTELRFALPDYFYNPNTGDAPGSGFGDFAVGVKEQRRGLQRITSSGSAIRSAFGRFVARG